MSGKIVEGIWDCAYCGADEIGGLQKYCPNCGHPQSKDTKFRMGTAKRYLTEEEINTVGSEPDWLCDYCDTLNNDKFKYCKNCGAERTKENKDYFDLREEDRSSENNRQAIATGHSSGSVNAYAEGDFPVKSRYYFDLIEQDRSLENNRQVIATGDSSGNVDAYVEGDLPAKSLYDSMPEPKKKTKKKSINWLKLGKYIGIGALVTLVLTGLISLFIPREYEAVITEKTWERDVVIQEYKIVEESAWDRVPSGGRLLYSKQEIKSYDQVLDHYETKTRQVAKQVFDGYDTHTYYTDNGNGTFTEHTSQTPRYRTEYVTETYQEPVYKTVPVYGTKYYYEIEKWVYDRTKKSRGSNNEPYWPTYNLDNDERVGSKEESYYLHLFAEGEEKEYTYTCETQKEYNSYELNTRVSITVSAGMVIEIKSQE